MYHKRPFVIHGSGNMSSFWQPMASSSSGTAVISFDLLSTSRCRDARNTRYQAARYALPGRDVHPVGRASFVWRTVSGPHNGAQLWRELRDAGFRGGLRVVTEWATRQRLAARRDRSASGFTVPPPRRVARVLTADPETLEGAERRYLDQLLAISPALALARNLARRFAAIVRERKDGELDRWLAEAEGSELCSFAAGLRQDE